MLEGFNWVALRSGREDSQELEQNTICLVPNYNFLPDETQALLMTMKTQSELLAPMQSLL